MSADLMRGDGRIHQITAFTTARTINTDVQRCQGVHPLVGTFDCLQEKEGYPVG